MATPDVSLNGLTLNGLESDTGVKWTLERLDGWAGSPSSSITVAQKARASGGWAGRGYLTPRHVVIEGLVRAPTEADLEDAFDRLKVAASLSDVSLSVIEATRTRTATVRREDVVDIRYVTPTIGRWSIQMVAPDPRTFGTTVSGSTPLGSTSGGKTYPETYPHSYNSTVVSGQVHLVNEGNITGPLTLRIDGPVTGPYVTHVTSGVTLTFATSVVLGAGEWLEVDLERRQVLANGQSSRNGYITSRGWFGFEPGDNTFTFGATSYDASSLLTVTGRPSWQ